MSAHRTKTGTGRDTEPTNPRDFVGSVARGLAVLAAFGADAPQMTLSQVAARTGLTRAGARRFLLTLTALGYVSRHERQFRLTPKVLGLGYAYLASVPMASIAQPFLEAVTANTSESCSMAVLDEQDVVYVARSPAKRLLMVGIHVGSRFPAHMTSMGRVLLADLDAEALARYFQRAALVRRTSRTLTAEPAIRAALDKVRRQGYAILDQELEEGVRSVAVPIRDRATDRVIAAVNVSTNVLTVTKERLVKEFLPSLQVTAAEIRAALP
jgi:IclR family pca regulon transcriptional regulator